jgi:PAS domain-containing protein
VHVPFQAVTNGARSLTPSRSGERSPVVKCWTKRREPPPDRSLEPQLRAALNLIPAYAWYAAPSGALTLVNERCADSLGLGKDHPLRFGADIGTLLTAAELELELRLLNRGGSYRWFVARYNPLREDMAIMLDWFEVVATALASRRQPRAGPHEHARRVDEEEPALRLNRTPSKQRGSAS